MVPHSLLMSRSQLAQSPSGVRPIHRKIAVLIAKLHGNTCIHLSRCVMLLEFNLKTDVKLSTWTLRGWSLRQGSIRHVCLRCSPSPRSPISHHGHIALVTSLMTHTLDRVARGTARALTAGISPAYCQLGCWRTLRRPPTEHVPWPDTVFPVSRALRHKLPPLLRHVFIEARTCHAHLSHRWARSFNSVINGMDIPCCRNASFLLVRGGGISTSSSLGTSSLFRLLGL